MIERYSEILRVASYPTSQLFSGYFNRLFRRLALELSPCLIAEMNTVSYTSPTVGTVALRPRVRVGMAPYLPALETASWSQTFHRLRCRLARHLSTEIKLKSFENKA